MKKPLLNYWGRLFAQSKTFYGAKLRLYLARKHFERSLSETGLFRFLFGWLIPEKVTPNRMIEKLVPIFGLNDDHVRQINITIQQIESQEYIGHGDCNRLGEFFPGLTMSLCNVIGLKIKDVNFLLKNGSISSSMLSRVFRDYELMWKE